MPKIIRAILVLFAFCLALPVLSVLLKAFDFNVLSGGVLLQMVQTVLPRYALHSIALCAIVAIGTALIGMTTACAVSLFEFRGKRFFEWALLLPLAMPAYVSAYAYTDYLQYSGAAQTWVRETWGLQGRVLPEIRSLWGAAFLFIFTLYPYVYLLTRAALLDRASHLMEAARLLGAPLPRRIKTIALPLSRPAVAAGVALVMMETLADFGVASYFGIQTFSTGIYKAWLVMDDAVAAAQLSVLLLILVFALLKLERHARRNSHFSTLKGNKPKAQDAQAKPLHGKTQWAAQMLCFLPIALGFILPVALLLRAYFAEINLSVDYGQFGRAIFSSLKLGAIAAVLAVLLAWILSFMQRRNASVKNQISFFNTLVQLVGMGYAVPGVVIVVGLLIPVAALQVWLPEWNVGSIVTTTIFGIVWAYLVRFTAVALQSIQSAYSRIPVQIDDSARMLGAGSWRIFLLSAPLLSKSLVVALILVFVDVMKELPATLVLRPFEHDTLAVLAYNFAKDERLAEAALPSLALVLVGLIPVILLSRNLRSTAS